MRLRIFVEDRADPAARLAWILFDARGQVLREERTTLDAMPRARHVQLILPATRVLYTRLALPRVGAATVRELLPYAVEDRLLADPAHIHAVAGRRTEGPDSTVAVVDRDWLGLTLDTLRRNGFAPTHACGESALALGALHEWHVVWRTDGGLLVDDREVGVTFEHPNDTEVPLALRIALDEAAARGERPARVLVHCESGAPPPALERWSTASGIAFSRSDDWETLRRRPVPAGAIELLQGDFGPHRGLSLIRIPRAALALAATILVLQAAFVALDSWRLDRERVDLEARREAIFRSAFPEARTVVDPDLQMRRNLADLRRSRGLTAGDDFLAQLTRAAREARGPLRSVEYANRRLEVR
jgi:general secretion pathway protein L